MSNNYTKKFKLELPTLRVNADGDGVGSGNLATENVTPENVAPENEVATAPTDKGTSLKTVMDDAHSALDDYGSFSFSKQKEQDDLYKRYIDRNFSYDINSDELYKVYKDRFTEQARLASEDAMGRAAALSGGYGNSYAQSVGAQAYQKVLEGLDDKGLELYQMAWDRYNQEGQDMLYKLSALDKQKADEREIFDEGYNNLLEKYNLAAGDYQAYIDDMAASEKATADWYAANTWGNTGVIDPKTGDVTYVNGKGERAAYGMNVNPHTNSVNPDLDYNEKYWNDLITRSYQPTSVVEPGGKRSKLTLPEGGLEYDVEGNGKYEPIFVSESGYYYVWNDMNNDYDNIPKEKYEKLWREQHPGSPLPDKKGSQGTQQRNYGNYKRSEGVNGIY